MAPVTHAGGGHADPPRCRACGAAGLRCLGRCPEFPAEVIGSTTVPEHARGSLWVCGHCGLGQRSPCLSVGELSDLYRECPPHPALGAGANAAWEVSRRRLVQCRSKSAGLRVLDIGCSDGSFLTSLPASWRTFGVEPGLAGQAAARRAGIDILGSDVLGLDGALAGSMDAITLFDVFEHLHDPVPVLGAALRLLKSGGTMAISTGNMGAWTWRWLGNSHWYLQSPYHITLGAPTFFQWLRAREGLQSVRFQYIPHHLGAADRLYQAPVALYFGCARRRGAWRLLRRLILSVPGYGNLRHAEHVRWTMNLKDHMVVWLRK